MSQRSRGFPAGRACLAQIPRQARWRTLVAAILIALTTTPVVAWGRHNLGGVEAEGRYSVVFPLQAAMPNPTLTPGATNPDVTQDTLDETICRKGGYTKSIRPPQAYTAKLKREQIRAYGYADYRMRDYEEDHLISLELGGSPDSPKNLWPEPHHVIGGWGSYAKDKLENRLHRLVCDRRVTLKEAQRDIATHWTDAYKSYIGPVPDERRGNGSPSE
ncbi:MAG: hypothetical protein WBX11_13880 [Thiobacillaceae bacterium]